MTPAILLIGANGQVGRALRELLPRIGEVTALDRTRLDLTQPEEIRRAIRHFRPAWIVNAAAYTQVDKAESDELLARTVNAEAPAVIAEEAQKIGTSLIHFSTDYVFDGRKTAPYEENDLPNPRSIYGRTKLEAERAIQASGAAHLIFRIAWIYATEGRNFLLSILRQATQREELRVVRDQTGSPTLSTEIAGATTKILGGLLLTQGGRRALENLSGTYHMTAGGQTTWFDFANAILEEAANAPSQRPWFAAATGNLPLIVRRVIPIATGEYPTPARRPAYSVLSNARLQSTFGVQLPGWREQLYSIFRD